MSWEQLQAISKQNKADALRYSQGKPSTCPIDGTLLIQGKHGQLNCPFGNYRWPEYGVGTT
jgi:hypothetical protein